MEDVIDGQLLLKYNGIEWLKTENRSRIAIEMKKSYEGNLVFTLPPKKHQSLMGCDPKTNHDQNLCIITYT